MTQIRVRRENLRDIVESRARSCGDLMAARRDVGLRVQKALAEDKAKSLWKNLSIRSLWEAFAGPPTPEFFNEVTLHESALVSTQFYTLTGNIIQQAILEGYDAVSGLIGDELVTPMQSKLKEETLSGTQAIPEPGVVREGEEYPEIKFDEKSLRAPEPDKRGYKITITRETIMFDQTGTIRLRANDVGAKMRTNRESEILYTVADVAGYKRYYPKLNTGEYGQADLYRTTGNNDTSVWYLRNITSVVNAFSNFASISTAMTSFAGRRDEQGQPIYFVPTVILAPMALKMAILNALNSTIIRVDDTLGNQDVRQTGPNPTEQIVGGRLTPLFSPLLDSLSTSTWYMGDPRRTFVEQIHWPITVRAAVPTESEQMDRDVVAKFGASRKSAVNTRDDTFWLRNTAT